MNSSLCTVSAIIVLLLVLLAMLVLPLNYSGVYVEDVGNWDKDMMITYR